MKGYKDCPHCQESIRGAATRICPHCGENSVVNPFRQLSQSSRQAGKKLRQNLQRRTWRIEEVVRVLKEEAVSVDEFANIYVGIMAA